MVILLASRHSHPVLLRAEKHTTLMAILLLTARLASGTKLTRLSIIENLWPGGINLTFVWLPLLILLHKL